MTTVTNVEQEAAAIGAKSEECWALVGRVAASSQLRRAPRLQQILLFIGTRSLKEGCDRLQEQEIGAKVFHRPDSYDTSLDNIVRASVSDLRRRIDAYFSTEGSHETLMMEIPRGSYIPVFHYRINTVERPTEFAAEPPTDVSPAMPATETPTVLANPRQMILVLTLAGALIFVLTVGCFYFWNKYHTLHQPLYAWQSKPVVTELWSQFLKANTNTDIVISDTGIGLAEALSHQSFTLSDYLSHSYISQLQSARMSPDTHAAINRVLAWNLANPDEFALARRLLALDPLGRNMHLYNARNYMADLIKRDNVILIGARKSNPWDELFDGRMNFITEFDSPRVVNRSPLKGEQTTYVPAGTDGFCIIAYMPNPDHSGVVMMIEGTNAEATEAASDFLFSNEQLSQLKTILHADDLPYFQVLLKVSAVRGTPLSVTIEAYRTYSTPH